MSSPFKHEVDKLLCALRRASIVFFRIARFINIAQLSFKAHEARFNDRIGLHGCMLSRGFRSARTRTRARAIAIARELAFPKMFKDCSDRERAGAGQHMAMGRNSC